jgi:hypothetical protein
MTQDRWTPVPENDFKRLIEAYAETGDLEELLGELDPEELEEMRQDPEFAALLPPKPRRRPPIEEWGDYRCRAKAARGDDDVDYEYVDKEVRRLRGEEVDDD